MDKRIVSFAMIMVLTVLLTITSCEKFEGSQTIPAYLVVDTIKLVKNPLIEEGFLTHSITDVWVYVDDDIIGAFELPAVVPVLAEGEHKITLYAGVKFNGMSGTRGSYPFYRPFVKEDFTLFADSLMTFSPSVSYYDNADFIWIEDFEDGNISYVPTPNSDTSLQWKFYEPAQPDLGYASGIAYLTSEKTVLEVTIQSESNPSGFPLPLSGVPVFLEIDFNTNNSSVVGIFLRNISTGELKQHPVLVLNPSGNVWRKVYVNLTPAITDNQQADYYYVFFRADKDAGVASPVLMFDNIKLIQRGTL